MNKLYYKDCGLDYIYLRNGFTTEKTPYGNGYAIRDIEGLHKAIALTVVEEVPTLRGMEVRFLRSVLGLSQSCLGQMLAKTRGMVAKWEARPYDEIPKDTANLLRIWVIGHLHKNEKASKIINLLRNIDAHKEEDILLGRTNKNGWDQHAA